MSGRGGRGRGRGGRGRGPSGPLVSSGAPPASSEMGASPQTRTGDTSANKRPRVSGSTPQEGPNQAPKLQYPRKSGRSLVDDFAADVNAHEKWIIESQEIKANRLKKVMDNMKFHPVEKWDTLDRSIQKQLRSTTAQSSGDEFFDKLMAALSVDLENASKLITSAVAEVGLGDNKDSLGALTRSGRNFRKKMRAERQSSLLIHTAAGIRERDDPERSVLPFWEDYDPDDHVYTDTEDEDGRERNCPQVSMLRKILKSIYQEEKQLLLNGRSLAIYNQSGDLNEVGDDNKLTLQTLTHSENQLIRNKNRKQWQEWLQASSFAPWLVSRANRLYPVDSIAYQKNFIEKPTVQFADLFLKCMAEKFPHRKVSSIVEKLSIDKNSKWNELVGPLTWLIDDYRLQRHSSSSIRLKVQSSDGCLMVGNLLQSWGRPVARGYDMSKFAHEILNWLNTVHEPLRSLTILPGVKPRSRVTAHAAIDVLKKRGLFNSGGALKDQPGTLRTTEDSETVQQSVSAMSHGSEQVRHFMEQDSAESDDEAAESKQEISVARKLANHPEQREFSGSGYGIDNTAIRVGAGFGRCRNNWDVNRRARRTPELAVQGESPAAFDFSSSEDEEVCVIDPQYKYRKKCRKFIVSQKRTGSNDAEPVDRPKKSSRHSHRDENNEKGKSKEKEKDTDKIKKTNWAESKSFGLLDEQWIVHKLKPRLRNLEKRFDADPNSKKPIGFYGRGSGADGSAFDLYAISLSEMERRFGGNKIYQNSKPETSSVVGSTDRIFYAVLNHEDSAVELCSGDHLQFFMGKSADAIFDSWMWKYFTAKGLVGAHNLHLLNKFVRYQHCADQNYFVWKDELSKADKLRESLQEKQAFVLPRYTRPRTQAFSTREALSKKGYPHVDADVGVGRKLLDGSELDDITFQRNVFGLSQSSVDPVRELSAQPSAWVEAKDSVGAPAGLETKPSHFVQLLPKERAMDERRAGQLLHSSKVAAEQVSITEGYGELFNNSETFSDLQKGWSGNGLRLRKSISRKYGGLFPEYFSSHYRSFRSQYQNLRANVAERAEYEARFRA